MGSQTLQKSRPEKRRSLLPLLGLCFLLGSSLFASPPSFALPPLQLYIELTPPGESLKLPPGEYAGPAVIRRPIYIEGGGRVTVNGGGKGTILRVLADGVTVRGLHLTSSGGSHDQIDSGILIEANNALIEDNLIDEVLFGIHLKKSNHSTIRNNRISSKEAEPSRRGEGLRMWYSSNNRIVDNHFIGVRDLLFSNSRDNLIQGNTISKSRIGMELVFSPDNIISDNLINRNLAGIVGIYSDNLGIRDNTIEHIRSFSGSALAIKGSSGVKINRNKILHCTRGVTANTPTHQENTITLKNNFFAYNDVALYFYGDKGGHIVRGNQFIHNQAQVAVSSPHSARGNDWRGNYWDDYKGFDLDEDGVGDLPHEIYLYADRIWMDRPVTSFFRGTPILQVIDFIERLAPFTEPALVLRDLLPKSH